ncbi:uncharacterized protein METZ01_LOCUS227789 [marine metagenome]|uniref:Uncharacterized protein n=1 Tax=marine metagenome TaxID=408172 RepID=A0A382GJJ1_9ZZZZ
MYHMIVSIPYSLIATMDTTTQLFLLRLLMVFFSCGVIILAFKIGQVLYPEDQLPFVATTCLCFYSQFVHIGSIVSYDVLVNLFASLFLYYLLKANCSGNGWHHVLKSGFFLGMALFTKASALMLLPGVIFWWMLNGMKTKAWREITLKAAILSLTAFCIGGWWYAKNLWLYQQFVFSEFGETPSWHYSGEMNEGFGLITIETLGWLKQVSIIQNYWQALWNSFYGLTGSFGWGNVPLKPWMYICSGMVFGSAIIGAGVTLTRIVRTPLQEYINKYSTHVLFYGVCICYCALLFLERGKFVMGRYYFPIIIPAVYLFIVSIRNVFTANQRHVFLMCFTILFIIFDTLILLEIIIPRYYLIPPPSRLLDYF